MIIDYSISSYSLAPFEYGYRHIGLAITNQLPFEILGLLERVGHFVLGLLLCIPVLGHLVALADYYLNDRVRILYLHDELPYHRGMAHGQFFKKEIQLIYALVRLMAETQIARRGRDFFERAVEEFQQSLDHDILTEMQGLSEGSEVPLDQIFQAHAYVDIFAGTYGCSAVASTFAENGAPLGRVACTNHFFGGEPNADSAQRYATLTTGRLAPTVESHMGLLSQTVRNDTIQSIVFDLQTDELVYSAAWSQAACKTYTRMRPFEGERPPPLPSSGGSRHTFIARNLDWPWQVLAPYTTVLVNGSTRNKNEFINISFPGFIGVLTGVNRSGVALACCQAGSERSGAGLPNTLLFRQLLERASSTDEAIEELTKTRAGSSMNLLIASPAKIARVELHPERSCSLISGGFINVIKEI